MSTLSKLELEIMLQANDYRDFVDYLIGQDIPMAIDDDFNEVFSGMAEYFVSIYYNDYTCEDTLLYLEEYASFNGKLDTNNLFDCVMQGCLNVYYEMIIDHKDGILQALNEHYQTTLDTTTFNFESNKRAIFEYCQENF